MSIFDYQAVGANYKVRPVAVTSQRMHYEVSEGETFLGEYFSPRNAKQAPLVILVHGFGDACVAPCLTMARLLVKRGIAAFIFYLAFHSRRSVEAEKGYSDPVSPRDWLETHQSSVREIRRIIDWAVKREEIDPQKIAIAGISLGGMISSMAMAAEKRIAAGIFIAIGGNMEELSIGGRRNGITTGHSCSLEECHATYSQYPAYLARVGEQGVDKVVPAKDCFLFDPLTYAHYLRERPILMVNAREDEIVSRDSTLKLWEAYGQPRLVWLAGSHAEAYSQSASISDEIIIFLSSIRT
jgi:dienelactone hydrolase